MKKNVASQSIGIEAITAADGTAFTGTVSVLVTIDNGTQTAGGGTSPAHEGNGYHSYTPTQAETNGDHVAFTFNGTGMIPATVQVYTTFPQSVDNATNIATILADTAEIGTAGAGLTNINLPNQTMDITGNISGSVGSVTGAVGSVTGAVGSVTGAVGSVTGAVGSVTAGVTVSTNSDKAGYSISGTKTTLDALNDIAATAIVSAGAITTAAGAVSNVTLVATTTTNTDMRGTDGANTTAPDNASIAAILVDTGTTLPAQITALNNISAADVLAAGDADGYSLEEALKLLLSASTGVLAGAATSTITIKAADGSKTRLTATVDVDGNRSVVVKDATG